MPDLETPVATAQPDSPAPTPTPSQQAVKDNDFAKYRAARVDERSVSKPADSRKFEGPPAPASAPASETPPAAAIVAPPENRANRREREQLETNERVRRAVDAATADLRAEIGRLKSAAPGSETKPTAPALKAESDPEPDPSDATKYPDGQYDRKFLKDQARWEARDELRTHEAKQQETRTTEQATRTRAEAERAYTTRSTAFVEKITAARAHDAEAYDRIDPRLFDLVPSIKRPDGEPITFGHAVADALLTSEHPVALMLHLSDPQEVDRLANLPPDGFYRELGRIEQRLAASLAPPPPPIPKLSSAPPPAPTVGERPATPSDPAKRAIAESNFPAFRAARLAERLALSR